MGRRMKMSNAERAKQFMPFAALKGYEQALRKKEEEVERMDPYIPLRRKQMVSR